MPHERRLRTAILALGLAVGLALRLWGAVSDDGIYWPDEIYQSFEPAHRLLFGYGLVAWEFIDGARNWALPGLVAGLIKVAVAMGGDAPQVYVHFVKIAFGCLGALAGWGVYLLARSAGASRLIASAAAAAYALSAPIIYFAPRAMAENAGAVCAVFGLALCLRRGASKRMLVAGACLVGAGVLFRLQTGVFPAVLVIALLARKQWKSAAWVFGTLLVWAFAYGLLDKLTWGAWFHSAIKYVTFNLIEKGASNWGESGWTYYFRYLWTAMPALTVLTFAASLLSVRRAPALVALIAGFFAIHLAVGHKEWRFILPVLPLLFASAAVGLSQVKATWWQAAAVAGFLIPAGVSAARLKSLTMGDLGAYLDRPTSTAWDENGPINRLLFAAHAIPDLCGVRVDVQHLAWVGGHSHLHRNVPLYMGNASPNAHTFSHLIVPKGTGLAAVAADGPLELVRAPWQDCVPDTGYNNRLP